MEVEVGPLEKNIVIKLPINIGSDIQTDMASLGQPNAQIGFSLPAREYFFNILQLLIQKETSFILVDIICPRFNFPNFDIFTEQPPQGEWAYHPMPGAPISKLVFFFRFIIIIFIITFCIQIHLIILNPQLHTRLREDIPTILYPAILQVWKVPQFRPASQF